MKIFDAINWGFSVLFDNNIPNPKVDTEYILSYILDIDRFNLYLNKDKLLTENEIKKFEDLINIRKTRKPLQYILKYTNFYGLDFYVDENVLIPRPETEYLCEHAINIIGNKSLKILDLCTGSGAIAITISKQCPNSIVYGSDISEKALNIAKKNSITNKTKVIFILSDLFQNLGNYKFDLIISNPPYIANDVCKKLQEEVMYEPLLALDGGCNGLEIIYRIVDDAPKYINNKGHLLMEIGDDQGSALNNILSKNFSDIKIIKDLQNRNRYVYSKLKEQI